MAPERLPNRFGDFTDKAGGFHALACGTDPTIWKTGHRGNDGTEVAVQYKSRTRKVFYGVLIFYARKLIVGVGAWVGGCHGKAVAGRGSCAYHRVIDLFLVWFNDCPILIKLAPEEMEMMGQLRTVCLMQQLTGATASAATCRSTGTRTHLDTHGHTLTQTHTH